MPFSPLRPGDPQQVGPYRLTGQLGAGGMGIVYLARSRAGIPVALKLIRPEYAADPTFRARFTREVETGRRVHGVCIARFLDADSEADRPYLVTEYVDGPGLGEVVAARGPLRGPQLQALAAGLAEGLVSLHRAGVVHRDLKPSNVLLARDAPKIIDFGIAHAGDDTSMTRTGHVVGSAGWMAPEQATGQRVTMAADVFAWASTMAYASTGRPPFGEGQPTAVIYRVVHQEPDLGGVPDALLPALRAAFDKDPASRPDPSRLLAMVTGQPAADPSGEVTRMLDLAWLPVAPVAAAAAAEASAALARPLDPIPPVGSGGPGGPGGPSGPGGPGGHPPPPAAAGGGRSPGQTALIVLAGVLALALGAVVVWALTRGGDGSTAATTTTTAAPTTVAPTTSTTTTTTAPTTTVAPTTSTTTTTVPPLDPGQAWTDVEASLPGGTASTGVLPGDPISAVTAEGTEVQVWSWSDDAQSWSRTDAVTLRDPISGPDALTPTRLTEGDRPDVLIALDGDRGSVLALADDRGALVPFDGPDQEDQVLSILEPRVGGAKISGSLDDSDAIITWRYDAGSAAFAVEKVRD